MAKTRQLELWCSDLGIDVPPSPPELRSKLGWIEPHTWATRPIPWSLYRVEAWAEEAEHGDAPDYLVIGHAGHGVNSYALSYFLVHQNLQLFLQMGLGGVYMDGDHSRRAVRAALRAAEELVQAAENAAPRCAGRSPMRVIASDFYGARWTRPSERNAGPTEAMEAAFATEQVLACLSAATNWFVVHAGEPA